VYQGGLNATVIRLADCFREAVRENAAAIVLVHNHPSGAPRGAEM
jgi:DNA repair protein RadC